MRYFLWLTFLQAFWCYPLKIHPKYLTAWPGSCVLIPCQIEEKLNSKKVFATSVLWYFNPFLNMTLFDYVGSPLYHSSRISNQVETVPSPDFQGRVRFVGDLSKRDCSLLISQLQKKDSGPYGVKVTASVENQDFRQILYTSVSLNISDAFPKPKLEILKCKERWALQVICSVPSHCPEDPITICFRGLEKHYLSSVKTTMENGMLQMTATIQPAWQPQKKKITCLLSNKDGSQKSSTTLEIDLKSCPNDVQVFLVNRMPIREGDTVTLNCSVGGSLPGNSWYNWWKIDSHREDYKYSGSKLLNFSARFGSVASYKCEACNDFGCTSSPLLTVEVFFAPKEVKIWKKPEGQTEEGSTVVLHCDVSSANPTNLTYTWYKDGERMLLDYPHEYLDLISIDPTQSGSYWCEASNVVGKAISPTITLHVICFHCDKNPLSIVPNALVAWEGSCIVIPCHISETLSSGVVNAVSVVWNFKPFQDNIWSNENITLLYNSSQISGAITTVTAHALSSRAWFIGNLTNRDCSLLVSPVQIGDSGIYEAGVEVSSDKYPWLFKRFLSASLNITVSPPEPTLEIIPLNIQEKRRTQVICSVPYHCPHKLISLTFHGLEEERVSLQKRTTGEGVIQAILSFEPTWEDDGKVLTCLLSSGTERLSQSSMKLDVTYVPKDVQLTMINHLPIEEGDIIVLNCSFGSSNPNDNWFNWFKSDPSMIEYKYSGPNVLTYLATPGPYNTSYECEVCNGFGCTSSPAITVEVLSSNH